MDPDVEVERVSRLYRNTATSFSYLKFKLKNKQNITQSVKFWYKFCSNKLLLPAHTRQF